MAVPPMSRSVTQAHDLLGAVLNLICDDLTATIEELKTKGLCHARNREQRVRNQDDDRFAKRR